MEGFPYSSLGEGTADACLSKNIKKMITDHGKSQKMLDLKHVEDDEVAGQMFPINFSLLVAFSFFH
jgi:hypothetical protein